jgi:uncharacterized protein with HEPN domain
MSSERVYVDFVNDMIQAIEDVKSFVAERDLIECLAERQTNYAVIRALEILGEAAAKISPELREKYSDIPWQQMIGMRNKLIHAYFGVDNEIIAEVVRTELPALLPKLLQMRDTM